MADKIKILWTHDEFDGPDNGLALYKGKKVWFKRCDKVFGIFSLTEYTINMLEENRQQYCQVSGTPMFHGQARVIKAVQQAVKPDIADMLAKADLTEVECEIKGLANFKYHEHSYNPLNIGDVLIKTVGVADFENYYVAKPIIRE